MLTSLVTRTMDPSAPDAPSSSFQASPDGALAKSMVSSLQMDTKECLERLDAIDERLGVDRRKNHDEYLQFVRGGVYQDMPNPNATASTPLDARKPLSSIDDRIAQAKAEIMAGNETETEAKRRHEEMTKSIKNAENILGTLDRLAAHAGDNPAHRKDTATLEALEGYKALDEYKIDDVRKKT